jgi:hypothetical protein
MAVAIGLAGSGLLVFYYIVIMSIFAQKGMGPESGLLQQCSCGTAAAAAAADRALVITRVISLVFDCDSIHADQTSSNAFIGFCAGMQEL